MLVGAAGIFVELFAASLALFAWLNLEPGALRSVAYNVMLIGGGSTVFFNGNPLLRFDGYYILADAVGIPNLAARSRKHLGYLVQRHLFGLRDVESPATAPGERAWFVVYGIASVVYRLFILGVIVLFIAGKFFVVGVALAVWVALSQLVMPVVKGAAFVFTSPRVRRKRARALATTGLLALTLATLLFLLPVPSRTRAEGVVWLPERSQVRAGSEGFIRRILALPEAHVEAGDALIELEDPLLRAHVRVLEAELRAIRARHYALLTTNRIQAEILAEEVATVEANLARTRERADALILRSPGPGTFVVPRAQDLPGRFVRQGELIAFVTDFSTPTARVVVSQADIGLVRERTRAVEVRLAERIARPIPARILREVPAATNRLPSRALGTAGGGRFPVDPSDPEGTATLERVFQFDLELPAQVVHIGGRVHVRFDHGREAVATQSYRLFRRLFLSRFNV
jgi:putative peptide zinc metalloprotease protein